MDCKVSPQSIGLNPKKAEHATMELNQFLANLQVMYIKLHNLHWNVVGKSFFDLHEKTQVLYEKVAEQIDLVAERIKMIGMFPIGSLTAALELATIEELPDQDYNGPTVAMIVVQDLRELIGQLRHINENVSSEYTGGLTDEALHFFEKQHWLFCAYLSKGC